METLDQAKHQKKQEAKEEWRKFRKGNEEERTMEQHLSIVFGQPVRLARDDEMCSCGASAWIAFIKRDGAEVPWCGRNKS